MGTSRALILLLAAAGLCHCRLVRAPQGPVLRVEGQAFSLRCDVSDYEGPSEQDFEWKRVRGLESINVISTFDPRFPDGSLQERIHSGDISVSRLKDNAVELRVREARLTDSATYSCSTPSTDSVFSGNYHADVQLKVIPNSLVVVPDAVNRVIPEGGFFRLLCNASYDLMEGVHVSFTWSVIKASSQDLLTLGPGVGVTVGDGFMQRYTDGAMRLELGNASHGVVVSGAMPEDQGMYTCTARLWTREQGIWKRIQEKTVEMGDVSVTPAGSSLRVEVSDESRLSSGASLVLSCSVSVDGLGGVDLEVTWLLNGTRVLARWAPGGVVSGASDAVDLRRTGAGEFQLKLRGVESTDAGFYSCKVSVWIRHSSARWYEAAQKSSAPVWVQVIEHNADFRVALSSAVTPKFSGDPTELECRVSDQSIPPSGHLGVTWLFKARGDHVTRADHVTVASLDESGVLVPGGSYGGRVEAGLIAVTRVEPYAFKLRLLHTTREDVGEYLCDVTAWIGPQHENRTKMAEVRSPAFTVGFANKSPVLGVVAQRVTEARASGSTFEMTCRANTQNLPPGTALSVVVQSEPSVGSPSRQLASLGPEMVLKLEDARKGSAALVKVGKSEFEFRMSGVRGTDRGFYSCDVRAWSRAGGNWTEMARGVSNKVQIALEDGGSSFGVSIGSDTVSVFPWETVKMECDVRVTGTSPTTDDVAYELKWFLGRLKGSSRAFLLASVDRWGIVHRTPRNDSSDCNLERLGPRKFALNIHSIQESDAGEYHCTVTPWISSTGTWTQLPEVTSEKISLNVKFALWDSMKLPLLYGMCASVTVGAFSLAVGLVCAHCCFRSTSSTPRSRNKLLEMELD